MSNTPNLDTAINGWNRTGTMTHGDAKRLAKVAEMFRDVIQHYIRLERGKTFSWEYAEKSLKEADQLWSKDNG